MLVVGDAVDADDARAQRDRGARRRSASRAPTSSPSGSRAARRARRRPRATPCSAGATSRWPTALRLESDLNLLHLDHRRPRRGHRRVLREAARRGSRADERSVTARRVPASPARAPRARRAAPTRSASRSCPRRGPAPTCTSASPRARVAGAAAAARAPPTGGCTRVRRPRGRRSSTWSTGAGRRPVARPPQLVGRGGRRRSGGVDAARPRRCARAAAAPDPRARGRRRARSRGATVVVLGTAWAAPLAGRVLAAARCARRAGRAPASSRSVPAARRSSPRASSASRSTSADPPTATRSRRCSRRADVLVDGTRRGVLANIGLDDDRCARRPRLSVVRLAAFATTTGPGTGRPPSAAAAGRRGARSAAPRPYVGRRSGRRAARRRCSRSTARDSRHPGDA